LGLEAQQAALARLAEVERHWLVETYQKVETGKGSDTLDGRRQLAAALKAARKHKAPIIVAKPDDAQDAQDALHRGGAGRGSMARQNAFPYRAISLRLPQIDIGSPHAI
jgi:hypothetical protein